MTWWQGVVALVQHDRAVVCHDMAGSARRHGQAPVRTDGEAALPLRQVGLEVALELIRGLVVDALTLQSAAIPSAPQAATLGVPVHTLHTCSQDCPHLLAVDTGLADAP